MQLMGQCPLQTTLQYSQCITESAPTKKIRAMPMKKHEFISIVKHWQELQQHSTGFQQMLFEMKSFTDSFDSEIIIPSGKLLITDVIGLPEHIRWILSLLYNIFSEFIDTFFQGHFFKKSQAKTLNSFIVSWLLLFSQKILNHRNALLRCVN
jgi:hypothetical protein